MYGRVVYVYTSIEQRACDLAAYIINNNATVRAAANKFGVSKSTVHKAVMKGIVSSGWFGKRPRRELHISAHFFGRYMQLFSVLGGCRPIKFASDLFLCLLLS